MNPIRLMIVEDDPMVMDIHRRFVQSFSGFTVEATAQNGKEALETLNETDIDLVIMDIYMAELDGLETLRRIRQDRRDLDVIVVSAAHEIDTVREVMRLGAFDYVVKPFTYERLSQAMEGYRTYLKKKGELDQRDIDSIMRREARRTRDGCLPKGLSAIQLEKVLSCLNESDLGLSADEVAAITGVSRVTARRYLEHLVSIGQASVDQEHRSVGRPINLYRII